MSQVVKLALKSTEDFTYHEHDNGLKYFRHDYFEKHDNLELCPQSYLIKQLPKVTNPLHFHTQNQFQVFIEGSGSFGRYPIHPYVVHYAGAYTGYGPIVAGDEGLQYLTLRSSRDLGAKFLPEQMANFKRGPKHHYTSPELIPDDLSVLNQLGEVSFTWIHHDAQSQLGVGVLKIPKHHVHTLVVPHDIAGVFLVIMQGSIFANQQSLHKNENLYLRADEGMYHIETNQEAVQILFLQMPLKDSSYLS